MKPAIEFKVMRVRECTSAVQLIHTPQSAYDYWQANIPFSAWFDPCKEAFVVLILNTRRRIIGHNLVTLGSLDCCTVHSREVFRPAIVAAGSAIVLMHNLCAATHKLCYVACRFMCSDRWAVPTLAQVLRRKECYA